MYTNDLFTNISYSSIQFNTLANDNGTFELQVYVNGLQAICDNCLYSFLNSSTPKIYSISQNYLNDSSTLLTITGENYGSDLSKTKVVIGCQNCEVNTVTDTSITCTLNNLELGKQDIVVNIDGKYILFYFIYSAGSYFFIFIYFLNS